MEAGSRPIITRLNSAVTVQRRSQSATVMAGARPAPADVGDQLQRRIEAGGSQLPASLRHSVEARLGTRLPRVRIHEDHDAARLAESVGARALTFGSNVFFGRGEYQPGNPDGRRLLHHELIHTLQQRGSERLIQRAPKSRGKGTRESFDEEAKKLLAGSILFLRHMLVDIKRFVRDEEGAFVGLATPYMVEARKIVNSKDLVMTFEVENLTDQFLAIVRYLRTLVPQMKKASPDELAYIEGVDKAIVGAQADAKYLHRRADVVYHKLNDVSRAKTATDRLAQGVTETDLARIETQAQEAALLSPSEDLTEEYAEIGGRASRRREEKRKKPARGGEVITDESNRIERRGGSGKEFSVAEKARRSAMRVRAPKGGKRDYVVVENVTEHIQNEGVDESGEFARAFHSAVGTKAMETYRAMAADRSGQGILLFLVNATNNDFVLMRTTASENNDISRLASKALSESAVAQDDAAGEPVLTLDFGDRNIALDVKVVGGKVRVSAPRGDDARQLGVPNIFSGIELKPTDSVTVIRNGQSRVVHAMFLGEIAAEGRTDALIEGATLAWVPKTIDSGLDAMVELAREAKKIANAEIRAVVYRMVSDSELAESIIDDLQLVVDALFNGLVGISAMVGGFAKGMFSALIGIVDLIRGLGDWAYVLLKGLVTLDGTELRSKGERLRKRIVGIPNAISKYFQQWRKRYRDADDTEQARMIGELTGEILAILATAGTSAAKSVRGSWKLAEKIAIAGEQGLAKAAKALPKPALTPGMRPAYATPAGPPPSVRGLEGTASFSKKMAPKSGSTSRAAGRGTGVPSKTGTPANNAKTAQGAGTKGKSPEVQLEDAARLGASGESISGKVAESANKANAAASKEAMAPKVETVRPGTKRPIPDYSAVPSVNFLIQKSKGRLVDPHGGLQELLNRLGSKNPFVRRGAESEFRQLRDLLDDPNIKKIEYIKSSSKGRSTDVKITYKTGGKEHVEFHASSSTRQQSLVSAIQKKVTTTAGGSRNRTQFPEEIARLPDTGGRARFEFKKATVDDAKRAIQEVNRLNKRKSKLKTTIDPNANFITIKVRTGDELLFELLDGEYKFIKTKR